MPDEAVEYITICRPSEFATDREWAEDLHERVWLAEERANEAECALEQIQAAVGGWERARGIDLGADFPLSDARRESREQVAERLENALHAVRHDPIGGNVRHCVEDALRLIDGAGAAPPNKQDAGVV